jgi:hypothetical protein
MEVLKGPTVLGPIQMPEGGVHPMTESAEKEVEDLTDLPGSIMGEPADLHAVRRAARPGRRVAIVIKPVWLTVTIASGKLDREALAHKIRSIFEYLVSQGTPGCQGRGERRHPREEGPNIRKAVVRKRG